MKLKLGDICEFINGGAWSDKEYVTFGNPVLKVTNCKSRGFEIGDISYLPFSSSTKYSKNKLQLGDVIIATVGSHPNLVDSAAGRSCVVSSLVEGFYLNQNAVCVRTSKPSLLNQGYLGYLAKYRLFQHYIQSRGRGAANQMRIAIGSIKEFEFDFPDIKTQHRIASILSAYDDLIENNQKQIKLLEEAAQRLYKEWFVDLRFPNYENTPMVDGVPEGWRCVPLEDVISYEIGGGWGEENITEKFEKPAYVIRGTDFYGITHGSISDIPYRYHTESNLSSRMLSDGDIIFEVSGGSKTEGVARTVLIREALLESYNHPVMCASFCKLIRFVDKNLSQFMYDTFLYLRLSGKTSEFDKKSASSIVNYRWKDFLSQQFILIPSEKMLKKYNSLAEHYYNLIICNSKQIEKLKNARDRLLPKLMSGELEV